ncbi:ATP-binding cassette domain-containing protein [Blautia sp. MSJ-19]|uniref:ATP-binding cassette domain-containing protein n=1 Tax=Blautia sp. MSJ-19 TaxID=2841517 RepID=UPI003ABD08F0|nr:hypothetical protein [Blautia sp. MSJ-19]
MKELEQRIQEILRLIDLKGRQNEPVGRFSGGMKHRIGIGLALLNDPQFIFF